MSTGRFAWHDLQTTDIEGCKAFYGSLLGWTFAKPPMDAGDYELITAAGLQIGGLNGLGNGEASHWISYLSTDDIDQTIANALATGGTKLHGPHPVPGVGQIVFLRDPEGAEFALFQGEGDRAADTLPLSGAPDGVPAWHELMSNDVTSACKWYGELVGWGHVVWPMDNGSEYHGLMYGDAPVAGAFQNDTPGTPIAWTIYFESVGTIDEVMASIPDLGGQ